MPNNDPELVRLKAKYVQLRTRATDPAATDLERADALTAFLNVVGQLAVHAPSPDLQRRWIEQYRQLLPEVQALRGAVAAAYDETPSPVLLALDAVADRALRLGDTVVSAAGEVVAGVGQLGRALPLLVLGALVVAGIVGTGYVRHGGVSIRRA